MSPELITLADFRVPGYPSAPLTINGKPLSIFSEDFRPSNDSLQHEENKSCATIPIGIATVLYRWHPNALAAFLDLDAWFSLTWSVTVSFAGGEKSKVEIGRVGSQITFGTLDSTGESWEVMLTYNMVLQGEKRGEWVPNAGESMVGDEDLESDEINKLGEQWVKDVLKGKIWEAGKGVEHGFCVEYAPMDIFGDGLPMSPHWLYASPDLGTCAGCSRERGSGADSRETTMSRCSRCGTAAYCSLACQKSDWKVHRWICTMSLEDRGQVLKISEHGGLIGWDKSRTMVQTGEEVQSENPNFAEPQLKRVGAPADVESTL